MVGMPLAAAQMEDQMLSRPLAPKRENFQTDEEFREAVAYFKHRAANMGRHHLRGSHSK
jgi:hypothetical protein